MSENENAVVLQEKRSIVESIAKNFNMEPGKFLATIKATVVKPGSNGKPVSDEELAAFLMVANEYKLNPFTKEIYAFPSRRGGIEPMVPIDGWISMVNRHPAFDGVEDEDILDDEGKLMAIKTTMYRKDRSRPISHTEYLDECMDSKKEPWKKWPHRMLGHKSYIQCARKAFGFTGIYDQDEIDRAESVGDITPAKINEATVTAPFDVPLIDESRSIMVDGEQPGEKVNTETGETNVGTSLEEFEGEADIAIEPESEDKKSEATIVMSADEMIDRIVEIDNKFELNNWLKKHTGEINALSPEDNKRVMAVFADKGEEINNPGNEPLSEEGYKALIDSCQGKAGLNSLWFDRIEKEVTDSKMKIRLRNVMNDKMETLT